MARHQLDDRYIEELVCHLPPEAGSEDSELSESDDDEVQVASAAGRGQDVDHANDLPSSGEVDAPTEKEEEAQQGAVQSGSVGWLGGAGGGGSPVSLFFFCGKRQNTSSMSLSSTW